MGSSFLQAFRRFSSSSRRAHSDRRHFPSSQRWIFIIDAVITIPIAVGGFIFLPGVPWNAKPTFWLSQKVGRRSFVCFVSFRLLILSSSLRLLLQEIDLAASRMRAIGRKEAQPWTRTRVRSEAKIVRVFGSNRSFPSPSFSPRSIISSSLGSSGSFLLWYVTLRELVLLSSSADLPDASALSQCSSPGLDRSFYLSRPKTPGVYFYKQICSTTTPSLRVLSVSGEQHSLTSSSDRTRLILLVFSSPQVEVLQRRSQEGLSCSRPRSIFLRASGSCISFLVPRRQI